VARRRVVYPIDTSDWLANVVLGSLVVAVIALVGLLVLLNTDNGDGLTAQEARTEVPGGTATVVPSPTPSPAPTAGAEQPVTGTEQPTAPDDGAVATDETPGTSATPTPEPLQPRGLRSEPDEPPPVAPGGTATPPPAGATPPDERVSEDITPDGDATPQPDEPDEPVVPASPLDDPDRVPALVVTSTPLDVHTVISDLDGDGVEERVWAALVRNSVRVRVHRDVNGRWAEPADDASAVGAVADDLVELSVEDVTGDGRPDIHTKQWVGVNGESVSLWSFNDGRLRAMTASGGCWDGEDTFGVVGARVDPGQVLAICEENPLPPYLWSTAVYRWVDRMWTFQQRVGVYG
jgi:hypothetical protein